MVTPTRFDEKWCQPSLENMYTEYLVSTSSAVLDRCLHSFASCLSFVLLCSRSLSRRSLRVSVEVLSVLRQFVSRFSLLHHQGQKIQRDSCALAPSPRTRVGQWYLRSRSVPKITPDRRDYDLCE